MCETKANILIVDDLPEKLLVYRTVLEELGQNVVTASSGREALRHVLQEDFAVILLDVNMPDIDGFETAQLIRQRKRSSHVPIIFLTSFADEMRIQQGYATGGVDYIPAPVIPGILRAKVRVFVELYQMRQQVAEQAEERAKRAAAEAAAKRSTFLADASRALASTLDFEGTLTALVRAPIPHLADVTLVTLRSERGNLGRTVGAWQEDEGATTIQGEVDDIPDEMHAMLNSVLASGIGDLRARMVEFPLNPTDPKGATATMSVILLPLIARGRILGAMTFAATIERPLGPATIGLAEELCGRAAVALDNAMLVRDIQEADRRKNEFLAMLAHELRNPLAPIRNAVHLMRQADSASSDLSWARNVIDRQVTTLVRMVDDLLDVARINEGKIQLVVTELDANEVLAQALETSRPMIDAHQHSLSVRLTETPAYLRGDATRLSQVLSNLLNNAAKYTPSGGRIDIAAEAVDGEIVYRVRDNGRGIPPTYLTKVFDPFIQIDQSIDRAQGGLGIGLSLVRSLVEMHRGSVEAHSKGAGTGSEFVVRLPSCKRSDGTRETPASLQPAATPLRILVVDDNTDVAESLAMVLRLYNHDVVVAHDGVSAIEMAEDFDPQVVFLDIGLPGLNGYETALRLRNSKRLSLTLLVAISGYGQGEDLSRSAAAGFDHHLVKPVAPEVLTSLLADLGEARQRFKAKHVPALS